MPVPARATEQGKFAKFPKLATLPEGE